MIGPYVRRLRPASEIRALRAEVGLTAAGLGKRIGRSRADISRPENGHVADQASEAGATTIREYQQIFIPGLLHAPEFARARTDPAAILEPMTNGAPDGVVAGQVVRQRMFRRPVGPDYEPVVDELAIRRLTAPPPGVKRSLYRMAAAAKDNPKITLRVLPIDICIEGFATPRTSLSICTFADPRDPIVVAIITITPELFLTKSSEVEPHQILFDRLREQKLPESDSLNLIIDAVAMQ